MARHGDTRSPSPVGSAYSSSKRSRRDDEPHDRNRRNDARTHKRRSRSRSPDRRYRDRDSARRRDRSSDRRNDDSYRSGRKDRSRERRRSRDREVVKDYRRRSRDRDPRDRRDTSRDRTRRRRDGSTDSRKNGKREGSRDRLASKTSTGDRKEPIKAATPSGPTEEEKKAERLTKLEAWKQKQAAERERKQKELQGAGSTRNLLDEIDKKAANSPAFSPPAIASPVAASPRSPTTPNGDASPVPYAGKFDPKAIAKKATNSSTGITKLGTDIALPEIAKASATLNSAHAGLKANKLTAPGKLQPIPSATPLKARGNVSGFGLSTKNAAELEKPSSKRALDFEEEEGSRKKLEKLPTPPLTSSSMDEDAALANGTKEEEDDDDDDDEGLQDAGTEEEAAAAARAAAGKREERLQAQNLAYQTNGETAPNGDVEMTGVTTATDVPSEPAMEIATDAPEEEEELDPLDAFMTELGDPMTASNPTNSLKITKKPKQQAEAMFGDDDDIDMKAIEADPDDILAMASKKKKKDLPTVNHAKMNYESFRKSFYHEPSELSELTEEEVADLRLELDGIKIRGVDAPKPVLKWSQCGLGVQTLDVISKLSYEKPSSIQSQAIPAIMAGRDVIGVAKTGSGKTIAFLLPMFRHIKDQRRLENLDGPVGLIMTPTRELATQIHKECKPFLKALDLRAVCAYGGAPIKDQIADLKRGSEIIVCTPGRMIDLLAANSGRVTNLRRVTYVVLDEADRMFDMGFEPQVMKILANIRPDRQTVLFSATFPRQMEALARKTLSKPIEIVVGGRSVVAPEITQLVEVRPEESKFLRLLELLGNMYLEEKNEDDRALIFVDRQESADSLLKDLMRKGYPCMSIHGGKDQIDRDSTIEDFKAGVVPILIATSVAARGLDVKQLKLVVNYDAPNHLEDYVHRAGRTGRAGNTGTAVTFLTEEQDRYAVDIAKALKQSGQEVPEDVQKLVDKFSEKVKTGKEKYSGSGFGGKGLERLDQERDAARNRERKTYKTGEEGDEDEKEDNKKDKDDDLVAKAASVVQPASAPIPLPGVPKGIDLDGKITVHKTEAPSGSKNPLDRVSAAVANIHTRLNNTGVLRQGVPIDNKGPDAGAFHATLEINDFPQKARWAVTNRTNVAKILEATGTSITTKGSFYATGKEPQAGENPKLYILVEGDTEVVVTNAMRELMRLLKEGTIAAADSDARAPASGRYNVV
ncbi:MAG: pre-mRNA processing RNA-helicase [Icmadophila ericetorum]|nr:pre-mRNA processing RNA-helicase [Icmadophila ericetorum]